MIVTLNDVLEVLERVVSEEMTREDADRWAFSLVQKNECEALVFSPESKRDKIWASVMFLYGIDTQEAPGEYLHSQTDLKAELFKLRSLAKM